MALSENARPWIGAVLGIVFASGFIAMLSCSEAFTPGSVLTSFRALAIRAEPPLARPGDSVVLEALIFEPDAKPVSSFWIACDPDVAESVRSPCDDGEVLARLESGELGAGATLPEGLRALGTSSTAVYRAQETISGDRTAIILLVSSTDNQRVVSRKELPISAAAPANQNPEIEFILIESTRIDEGSRLSVKSGIEVTWSAIVTSTSAELYTTRRPDGTEEQRVEDIRIAWFTTVGQFGTELRPPSVRPIVDVFVDGGPRPPDVGPREGGGKSSIDEFGRKVTLNLPQLSEASADRVRIFVVVRDGRGGTTWAERSIRLLP